MLWSCYLTETAKERPRATFLQAPTATAATSGHLMAAGGYQNRGSADSSCHKATTAQPAEAFLQMGLLKDSHKLFVVTCQALASPILFTKAHGLLNQANPLLLRRN